MIFTKPFLVLLILLASCLYVQAQSTDIPLDSRAYHLLDRLEIKYGRFPSGYSSSVKPVSERGAVQFALQVDSFSMIPDTFYKKHPYWKELHLSPVDRYNMGELFNSYPEWVWDSTRVWKSRKPILKSFYTNPANLFEVNKPDFYLSFNPIILFQLGKENASGEELYINTRGLELQGLIARKVGFYLQFTENQERPPQFVQDLINGSEAVPGNGYYKNYQGTAYDYLNSTGYFSFNVAKYINIQFGYGKNFLGDGYRSLLLSGYSNNYLYLKTNLRIWKLNYENILGELISQYQRNNGDYLRPKKYIALHDLNLDLTHWLNIGVFEAITFSRVDHFEFEYLNPVIIYRSAEQQLGSPDKAHVGIHAKADFAHHFQLYAQFLLDEFRASQFFSHSGWWGNKWAFQLGGKYIDAFGVSNLDLQGEMNLVRPYTYTHYDSVSNYSNYNLPLADPLGANFREFIALAQYQTGKRLSLRGRIIYYEQGRDTGNLDWGSNIFLNYNLHYMDFGNRIGQGVGSKVLNATFTASYEIKFNLFLDLSLMYRRIGGPFFDQAPKNATEFLSAGLRWNIGRRVYDY